MLEMVDDSLRLAYEVNEYLDRLKDVDFVRGHLDEIYDRVKEYKNLMVLKGFDNPFGNLQTDLSGLTGQELAEAKKHLRFLRYLAQIKKITLTRAKISLAALAVGDRLIRLLGKDVDDLELLPLDGDLLGKVGRYGGVSTVVYSQLKMLLKMAQEPEEFTVRYSVDDEVKLVRLTHTDNLEERLQRSHPGTVLKVLSIESLRKPLIKNGYVRTVVACYYSLLSCVDRFDVLRKRYMNERIREYFDTVNKIGFDEWTHIIVLADHEDLMNELVEHGFVIRLREPITVSVGESISKEIYYSYDPDFEQELNSYKTRIRQALIRYAKRQLMEDLYIYYMTHSSSERERNNLFPTLVNPPNELQLRLFNELDWTYSDVLIEKLNLETTLPIRADEHRYLGPVLYSIRKGLDDKEVTRLFRVDYDGFVRVKQTILPLITGRGGRFLELVKRGEDKGNRAPSDLSNEKDTKD